MNTRTHTAQELYRFAQESPSVQRALQRTFKTLAAHKAAGDFDSGKALALLLKNNVRDAGRLYVQVHGENLAWPTVFPTYEREGCAALFLRQFDGWYESGIVGAVES